MDGVDTIQDPIPFQKPSGTKSHENPDIPFISKNQAINSPLFIPNRDFSHTVNTPNYTATPFIDITNLPEAPKHVTQLITCSKVDTCLMHKFRE